MSAPKVLDVSVSSWLFDMSKCRCLALDMASRNHVVTGMCSDRVSQCSASVQLFVDLVTFFDYASFQVVAISVTSSGIRLVPDMFEVTSSQRASKPGPEMETPQLAKHML